MANAVREEICATMTAVLAAAFPEGTVERNADRPATIEAPPWLNLIEGDQQPDHGNSSVRMYTMQMQLEAIVPCAGGENPGTALNAVYARALAALETAFATNRFGERASDFMEGALSAITDRDSEQAGGEFTLDLTIVYFTQPGDPTQLGPN